MSFIYIKDVFKSYCIRINLIRVKINYKNDKTLLYDIITFSKFKLSWAVYKRFK